MWKASWDYATAWRILRAWQIKCSVILRMQAGPSLAVWWRRRSRRLLLAFRGFANVTVAVLTWANQICVREQLSRLCISKPGVISQVACANSAKDAGKVLRRRCSASLMWQSVVLTWPGAITIKEQNKRRVVGVIHCSERSRQAMAPSQDFAISSPHRFRFSMYSFWIERNYHRPHLSILNWTLLSRTEVNFENRLSKKTS